MVKEGQGSLRVDAVDFQSTTPELDCQGNVNKNSNVSGQRHKVTAAAGLGWWNEDGPESVRKENILLTEWLGKKPHWRKSILKADLKIVWEPTWMNQW